MTSNLDDRIKEIESLHRQITNSIEAIGSANDDAAKSIEVSRIEEFIELYLKFKPAKEQTHE